MPRVKTASQKTRERMSAAQKKAVEARQRNADPVHTKERAALGKGYRKVDPLAPIAADKFFQRWPQDDDELDLFVQAVWGYRLPRTRVCPGHRAPFEAFADAYFARSPISVWKASRGFGGKSAMLSILCLTEILTLECGVTILGGSGAQSQNVHRSADSAWAAPNAPRKLLDKSTMFDTTLHSGGWMRSLTATALILSKPLNTASSPLCSSSSSVIAAQSLR